MNIPARAIRTIEHLLVLAHDGAEGYRQAAALVADFDTCKFLSNCAQQRESAARELTKLLVDFGRRAEPRNLLAGVVRRSWVDSLSKLEDSSVDGVLRACERGEVEALISFRKVFSSQLPMSITEVVQQELRLMRGVTQALRQFRIARTKPQPANALDVLSREHATLDRLYRALLDAYRTSDWERIGEAWSRFEATLRAHMEMEEQQILPSFHAHAPAEARKLLADHDEIRSLMDALGAAVELHVVRRDAVADLHGRLRAHHVREELLLYPWVDRELAAAGRGSTPVAAGVA